MSDVVHPGMFFTLHTCITYLLNSQEESSSSNSMCTLKVQEFALLSFGWWTGSCKFHQECINLLHSLNRTSKHFQFFQSATVCLNQNCNCHLFETKLLSSALSFIWRKWNSKVSESQREQSLWFGSGSQIYCSCMRAILSFHCQVSTTFPVHYARCLGKKWAAQITWNY